jgi:hypothetical protein
MRTPTKFHQPRVHITFITLGGLTCLPFDDPDSADGRSGTPARISFGWVHDEADGLVAEMESRRSPVPWVSAETRGLQLTCLKEATWIQKDLKARLIEHIRRTPAYEYAEDEEEFDRVTVFLFTTGGGVSLVDIPDERSSTGASYLPAREMLANYADVPDGILAEMLEGRLPLPWVSEQARQQAIRVIRRDTLNESLRERLLAHLARSPVYQVGDEPMTDDLGDRA